jgi:hypothetical protein
VISAAENSNKFPKKKPGFRRKKSVEDVDEFTLGSSIWSLPKGSKL